MNNGSIAKRYARALFAEAKAQFIDEDIYRLLGVLYSNLKTTPELQTALASPKVDATHKMALMVTASGVNSGAWLRAGHAPKVESYEDTLYTRFLRLLLEHHRETHLRMIILCYNDIYREHYAIDRVVLETAVAVDEELCDKVRNKVSSRTGRKVELVTRIVPQLLGGFRLRIADMRYDYSLASRLAIIKKKIHGTD